MYKRGFHQTPNDEDLSHSSTELAPSSSRCIGGADNDGSEHQRALKLVLSLTFEVFPVLAVVNRLLWGVSHHFILILDVM